MTNISIPLQLTPKGLQREENLKRSIDTNLYLIITTERFSSPADPMFGFVFNNLRFEMFNENEGVVFDSGDTETMSNTPKKKWAGWTNSSSASSTWAEAPR